MGKEIERKFLVKNDAWRNLGRSEEYRQGFLSTHPERVVRVRIAGEKATLTIKGKTDGLTRAEFEYPLPMDEARVLLDRMCERPIIEKVRHVIRYEGMVWEVDEFHGDNQGLIIAEVELPDENHPLTLPPWVGEDVSHDARYFNANLVANPYSRWGAGQG